MKTYPILLFWPEENKSSPLSRVRQVCEKYGVKFHSDPTKPYDLHFFWSYTPKSIIPDSFTLTAPRVINRGCWDIGKEKVNDIFNDIRVDPTTYQGIYVEKQDMQGQHWMHRLVTCPTIVRDGYIYQRYIEDRDGDSYVKYRIFYADGIDFILKRRQKDPFGMEYIGHEIIEKRLVFSLEAEEEFKGKCLKFGVDFAEIDFVLDCGNPVILDVNNIAGTRELGSEIQQAIDTCFLNFIQRRYDQSG